MIGELVTTGLARENGPFRDCGYDHYPEVLHVGVDPTAGVSRSIRKV